MAVGFSVAFMCFSVLDNISKTDAARLTELVLHDESCKCIYFIFEFKKSRLQVSAGFFV